MALPKRYETVARLGLDLDHRRPRRRARPGPHARRAVRAADRRASCQRPPAYSRGQGRRPARLRARARGGDGRAGRARGRGHALRAQLGARRTARRSRSSARRAPTCASLIADLGDAYCLELRRTAIGHFDVADADPERIVPLDDALDFLPAVTLAGEDARQAGPRRGGAPARREGTVRLLDDDGLIALAEPREDGTAQARRRLPRLHEGHLAPRCRAAPAPRRGRRVRRRAPRPPRGDRAAPTPS